MNIQGINIPPGLLPGIPQQQGINRSGPSTPPLIPQIGNPQVYPKNSYMGQAMRLAGGSHRPSDAPPGAGPGPFPRDNVLNPGAPPQMPPPQMPPQGPQIDPAFPNIVPDPSRRGGNVASPNDISGVFKQYLGRDPTPYEIEYYSDRERANQLYRDVISPRLTGAQPYGTPENPTMPTSASYLPGAAPGSQFGAPAPSAPTQVGMAPPQKVFDTPYGPIDISSIEGMNPDWFTRLQGF